MNYSLADMGLKIVFTIFFFLNIYRILKIVNKENHVLFGT